MKKYFLFLILLFFVPSFAMTPSSMVIKKRMLADLEFIKSNFEVKYAPSLWKKEFVNWDVEEAYQAAKERVLRLSNPSIKECQIILKKFFQSPKDYHVGISFLSTESATLPFMGLGAEGHYYVVYVNRTGDDCSLNEGDEILTFNGEPIMKAIEEWRREEIGNNVLETDQSLAELLFTTRLGFMGHKIPQGDVILTVRKKGSEKKEIVNLQWNYGEEKIKDPSQDLFSLSSSFTLKESSKKEVFKDFFNKKMMVAKYCNKAHPYAENVYWLGSKKSYLPPLGKMVWENDEDSLLDAYIFRITDSRLLPPGKKVLQVGYIRIPHYNASENEAEEFQKLISFMDYKTDALVIDQINNPGGSVFYMYALASMLSDKPLSAPKHRIALTQQEVAMATLILEALEPIENSQQAREVFGETIGGYEIDYHFVVACREFCNHLIDEWNEGNLFTSPIHLFGVDKIQPHSKDHYKKPILLVINSLGFSAADFLPAILQDNGCVTLFGTRTAGAGGYVLGTSYPNLLGVQMFQFTGSWAVRDNGEPLENLGVQPDIFYALTRKDLENNFSSYAGKIIETICSLCR